jgi:hypothetical protein
MKQLPYPIANWKNPREYPGDILDRIRRLGHSSDLKILLDKFSQEQIKLGVPEQFLWRWEFLRRYADYQREWNATTPDPEMENKYGQMYGYPDPRILCPENLFFWDMRRKYKKYIVSFTADVRRPIHELTNEFSEAVSSWRNHITKDKPRNKPAQKRWPILLRVLDAHAAGMTKTWIGKNIGTQEAEPAKYGSRLLKEALEAQLIVGRINK